MCPEEDRIRIGIDFDSTIAKIDLPWLERLNAARGTRYRPEDWSDWELSFLNPDDKRVFFDLFTPDLYENVEPYPFAPEAIRSIGTLAQVEMVSVTSNPEQDAKAFLEAKKIWLQKHIPELADKIISAETKTNLGLDILVDDAPHHYEDADCVCVLVRRPWNQSIRSPFEFSAWADGITGLIERITRERANFVR